jgi:hypothetical protein
LVARPFPAFSIRLRPSIGAAVRVP